MDGRPTGRAGASAVIELRLGGPGLEGVLTDALGTARRFRSWMELAGAIEQWRTAAAADALEPAPPAGAP